MDTNKLRQIIYFTPESPIETKEVVRLNQENFVKTTLIPGEYTTKYLKKIIGLGKKLGINLDEHGCDESGKKHIYYASAERRSQYNKPAYELLWQSEEGEVCIRVLNLAVSYEIPSGASDKLKSKVIDFLNTLGFGEIHIFAKE